MLFFNRKIFSLFLAMGVYAVTLAQRPLRPDALPPVNEEVAPKSILMADNLDDMADWKHYPSYETYVAMMRRFAEQYPSICRLDTIGCSVNNRLILCVKISDSVNIDQDEPEVFYSATMHGDELVGFHLMLHLIDSLLSAYGNDSRVTRLLDNVELFINPLSNPDGTYFGGDATVASARRNNANNIDLNRNYPDPFIPPAKAVIQPENAAMIDYVSAHHFLLAANIHAGAEVLNYPWDSFTSLQNPHPDAEWWQQISRRFVDTCRNVRPSMFSSVSPDGVIAGGDWYVITNGRQDYMNYYHNIHELTMELSVTKKLSSSQLPRYWEALAPSLLNFATEVFYLPATVAIERPRPSSEHVRVFPNPASDKVYVSVGDKVECVDVSTFPCGVHLIVVNGVTVKVVKM